MPMESIHIPLSCNQTDIVFALYNVANADEEP